MLLAFVLFSIVIFQFYRYRFRKIVENIDENVATPSDYSLILKRLPKGTTKDNIEEMIEERRKFLDENEKQIT